MTRKYIIIHSLDDSSKQNKGKRNFSLLLQGDMGMGEPHSLLATCASAENQICNHDWYGEGNGQRKPTRGECSNYGD